MRPFRTSHAGRRGNVTVIVVAFLALFLVLGLTFAFYSISEAEQSKAYLDSVNGGQTGVYPTTHDGAPPEADTLFNTVLRDVIYGPPDGLPGAFDSFRGHDLARLVYGWDPNNPTGATLPYNGVGLLNPQTVHPSLGAGTALPYSDRMINWTWAPSLAAADGRMAFMYDVDNNYVRNPKLGQPAFNPATYRYYAKNANYTYPDESNLFLASLDPTTGKVLLQSYYRPWLMVDGNGDHRPPSMKQPNGRDPTTGTNPINGISQGLPYPGYAPANAPNVNPDPWTNNLGRLVCLRPRPVDNMIQVGNAWISYFPYPKMNADGITYGDVENIEGKPGGVQYDAMWQDFDAPVRRWQGKNYKPLVALTIVDADSRINVNTAGNYYRIPGPNGSPVVYAHWSNQGVGPWEVNITKILNNNVAEAAQILKLPTNGQPAAAHNKYGSDSNPNRIYRNYPNEYQYTPGPVLINMPPPGSGAQFYAQVDFDARARSQVQNPRYQDNWVGHETNIVWGAAFLGPANGTAQAPIPDPNSRYGNGMYVRNPNAPFQVLYNERTNHPSMFNPYLERARALSTKVPDRSFGPAELRYLNEKYNYAVNATFPASELAALAPSSLGAPYFSSNQPNSRFLTTPVSNEFDVPGSTPWLAAALQYTMPPGQLYPAGQMQPLNIADGNTPPVGVQGKDFDPQSYRSLLTALGPVDINRKLTDYRNRADQPYGAGNYNPANAARALKDRQALAMDIFVRLLMVTTGMKLTDLPAAPAGPVDPVYDAYRWLAQLAVNIVDYIDDDDYITPFNWNPNVQAAPADQQGKAITAQANAGWVFGFERPRLTVNEVYGRVENDPNDQSVFNPAVGQKPVASMPYQTKFWIELHNTLTPQNANELGTLSDGACALLYNQNTGASVYQIVLAKNAAQAAELDKNDNVLGDVTQQNILAQTQFTPAGNNETHDRAGPNQLDQNGNGYTCRPQNVGGSPPPFYLVASEKNLPDDTQKTFQANRWDTNLTYKFGPVPWAALAVANKDEMGPRVLLRRLANPHDVPGPMNPYVTVDYFRFDPSMMQNALYADSTQPDGTQPGADPKNRTLEWHRQYSFGRRQPFAQFAETNGNNGPYAQQPQNSADGNPIGNGGAGNKEYVHQTLGRHNGTTDNWPNGNNDPTLDLPFQPLIHQDRICLNAAELLHVAAVRPYTFTNNFVTAGAPARWQYKANWFDSSVPANQSTLLFRALDFLRPHTPLDGIGYGGRVPGRVNINTAYANLGGTSPVVDAIVDPPMGDPFRFAGNRFTVADSMRVSQRLAFSRANGGNQFQNATDTPLWGTAVNFSPPSLPLKGGTPINKERTIVRQDAPTGMLYDPTAQETYKQGQGGDLQKYELLSKTFNQWTTRSNTFVVYATIGYFEVMNDGPYDETNRPVLGKELGTDDGTVSRHKFFAVLDRTNLSIDPSGPSPRQGQAPVYLEYQPQVPLPDPTTNPPYLITPDPDLPSQPPDNLPAPYNTASVVVRIPAVTQTPYPPPNPAQPTSSVSGYYDGVPWTLINPVIQNGNIVNASLVEVDIGGRKETMMVQLPPNAFDPSTGTATIILRPTNSNNPNYPRFLTQHYRGAAMRIVNPDPNQAASILGNPGPQAGFQYRSIRYAPVVRYAEQLR